MSFNSHSFAAGRYTVTFAGVSLGIFQSRDGSPGIEQRRLSQVIDETDAYAATPIGAIGRGSEAFWSGTLMEYSAATIRCAWPYASSATLLGIAGNVGTDDWDLAQALVLTVQAATPAATLGPATITASKAYLQENFPIRYYLDSMLRVLPVRLRLWPFLVSSTSYHYTMT